MINLNNKKNKSAVILNPEAGVKISGASVESVVNDGAKTKRYSAKRDLYGDFAYAQPLKMTALAFLLSLNLSTAFAETTCTLEGIKLIISGNGAFSGCPDDSQKTATEVIIGTGVTGIGNGTFQNATGLTSITIPKGVTYIGHDAFNGAKSLTSITIPDSVTSIGDRAFIGAESLTNIMCKGNEVSCADTVNALRARGYTGNISYPTDKTSCEGSDISLFVWDGSKCSRRNEEQCNSVAKYYYSDGKCQVLPKTQSACTGTNIEWNATDNKCVNKNYTPTGGDDIGDVSGDFNPADCYNNGQVPYNNQCWDEYPFAKKRWTPAEANEWLHDGNDNFVIITFKK